MSKTLLRLENMGLQINHEKKLQYSYRKNDWEKIHDFLDLIEKELFIKDRKMLSSDLQSNIILASIPSSIVVIDKFQNIIQQNESFIRAFDLAYLRDDKKKLWKVLKDDELKHSIQKSIETNSSFERAGYLDKESSKYYDIRFTPIQDNSDDIIGAVGLFHDVTHSKLTEKMRVDFVANVSHEMKTPLTSLKGYAQLLQSGTQSLSPEIKNLAAKIESNSEKLKDIFTSLLSLSKIESLNDLNLTQVELAPIISKVKNDLEAKYLNKKFSIEHSLTNETILADLNLLELVITNLIDNSIKYTKNHPIIKIKFSRENSYSTLSFIDNGCGIKEEDINRVFERFYRAQGVTASTVEGVGLGLSIVKHIANKHRASIKVTSKSHIGTVFDIKFPNEKIG